MSRLKIATANVAGQTVESLYKDLERMIIASPPGICPVDLALNFLRLCHAQTCGKCVPCRVGLGQLANLISDVLEGRADMGTLDVIEKLARDINNSADCAIGYEAAGMVLRGLEGFREDYIAHIKTGKCTYHITQPVPCVALCPAGVDIPGYVALVGEGRYADAVKLIRKDNPFPTACALICEHVSMQLEDATTKDTTGDWQVQEPTGLSYDISTSALVRSGDTITSSVAGKNLSDISSIYEASAPVKWLIANVSGDNNRTKGAVIASGSAIITQLTINAANKQNATYDTQLSGYGIYTVGA